MNINPRTEPSLSDLTLRARYLRSAYLASLFLRALSRVRAAAGGATTAPRRSQVAFERR